jgi:dolichol-phosphate hexosyltransferase
MMDLSAAEEKTRSTMQDLKAPPQPQQRFDLSDYGSSKVAVVILARNEENTIAQAVEGAAQFAHLVYVMDGRSSDATVALATKAGAVVVQDEGKGKGAAIRQSLSIVPADVLVFMDADGSHDPQDIPHLVLPIIKNKTDLCVGSRFSGGSDELSVSFEQLVRTIGNISMNIAINKRWNVELTDTLNGFRAVRRTSAVKIGLIENRHTIEQEMVMKMLRYGYRVMNAPAHEYPRLFGESHINITKEWPIFVWCVITNIVARDVFSKPRVSPAKETADGVDVLGKTKIAPELK